jgi:hypothetical protein
MGAQIPRGPRTLMSRKRNPRERPPHDANTQPSKREKHEKGQRRRLLGTGKEKKRQQPDWFQREPDDCR